jgi:hypothetical protein
MTRPKRAPKKRHLCREPGCEQRVLHEQRPGIDDWPKPVLLYCDEHLATFRSCEGNARSRRAGLVCRNHVMAGLPVCRVHGGDAPKWKAISQRSKAILDQPLFAARVERLVAARTRHDAALLGLDPDDLDW